jgi:ribosomal protein S9
MELPEALESVRYYEGIGRRKSSSARVRIYPAAKESPHFIVNGKALRASAIRFG